ncbi:hypothetical protein VTL71DRAFT_11173 [Oculimacula yallundae]|uniref:CxC6 like cysteine cluster associated with KDZ domain-containing protein n=1 Tax=Oculimacula yallundae TaxID=86028 RepID=A0ABR4CW85_9HELO
MVAASLLPRSFNPPACTDVIWDEHDTGFQSRICSMPYPSNTGKAAQTSLGKRAIEDIDDGFATIFSGLAMNTTDIVGQNCTLASNPTTTSDDGNNNIQHSDKAPESVDPDTSIERRNICASRADKLPYRTPLTDIPETSAKSWCFRPGPSPNKDHVANLCRSVEQLHFANGRIHSNIPFQDDFVVQRARGPAIPGNTTVENGASCVCVAGRERSVGFKVCNCDRCDALVINHGLAKVCKLLQHQCMDKGFSSGYMKTAFRGSMSNAIMSLFTFPSAKGERNEFVELDPVLAEEGAVVSTCRSGDEGRKNQDYSGPVVNCKEEPRVRLAGGRWCRDKIAGGDTGKIWVKEKEDPVDKLRGPSVGGFQQFG